MSLIYMVFWDSDWVDFEGLARPLFVTDTIEKLVAFFESDRKKKAEFREGELIVYSMYMDTKDGREEYIEYDEVFG
jgi:hypothetical protein